MGTRAFPRAKVYVRRLASIAATISLDIQAVLLTVEWSLGHYQTWPGLTFHAINTVRKLGIIR